MLNLLAERIQSQHGETNLLNCANLFEAARCVGGALREMHHRDGDALRMQGVEFNASFILGGQIKGESPRLFHIYAAGNFVEATPDTTYFQIGESKYGKPIIDRVIRRSMPLSEAAKCALISMDSTIRSNLSVGLPLDLVIVRRDEHRDQQPRRHRQHQRILPSHPRALGRGVARDFLRLAEPGLAHELAARARPAGATRNARPDPAAVAQIERGRTAAMSEISSARLRETVAAIRAALGPAGCLEDPGAIEPFLSDFRGLYRGNTPLVALPATTAEVSTVLAICNESRVGVVPHGGNTSYCGGATPHARARRSCWACAA